MSDLIKLAIGGEPWSPSPDSELLEEYARYDMPTCGVISQSGSLFLFECVEGVELDFNVWIYALLELNEKELLDRLDASQLEEAIDRIFLTRRVTIALAENDGIITGVETYLDKSDEVDIRTAALRAIKSLLEHERGGISGVIEMALE